MAGRFAFIVLISLGAIFAETDQYRQASPRYEWSFPRDHQAHHGFKTEWWYYTGRLLGADGREFGFQFTIFKIERKPNPLANFQSDATIFMLHAAVTDVSGNQFRYTEKIQRLYPGMAGEEDGALFVCGDSLRIAPAGHAIRFHSREFSFDLKLVSPMGPILQGENGFSQKSARRGAASEYFSEVDLVGEGSLTFGDLNTRVRAIAWMDHEFGSNFLSDDETGWDWMHVSLENGRRFMFFRVRSVSGKEYISGAEVNAGRIQLLPAISLQPGRIWTSVRTNADYPVEWLVLAAGCQMNIAPAIDDQELRPIFSRISYWEGLVRVRANCGGQIIRGDGYLELTGYAGSIQGRF